MPALYRVHERPEATAVERLIDQLASLGVPTPPVPGGHMTPQQAADVVGEASQLVADWVGAHGGHGAPRADPARAAVAEAGLLRRPQPRARRPAVAALLPLHLADPPLPGPDLPPRAAVGDRRRGAGARGLVGGGGGAVDLGARAGGDDDRARRRRHRPLLPARAARCRRGRRRRRSSRARSSA